MKILFLIVLFVLNCFSFVYAQNNSEVIAQVGNKKILLDDFNKKFNEIKGQTVNPPTKAQFLEDLVRYELGLIEAEKRGLNKDPKIQDRMNQELYKALLEKELGEKVQKIEVTEKEMQTYYKNNPQIRTSHILIEFKPGATEAQKQEAKKRATEIYEKEVKGSKRPFEELVRLFSDDSLSKQSGGDIGWQSRVTIVPSYYDTIAAMKVDEVKGLIETQFGYHIVKVTGRRTYDNADKRTIRAAVFDEKRRLMFNEYFEKIKKTSNIKVNNKLLE